MQLVRAPCHMTKQVVTTFVPKKGAEGPKKTPEKSVFPKRVNTSECRMSGAEVMETIREIWTVCSGFLPGGAWPQKGVPPMNYPQLRPDTQIFHVPAGCDRRRADRRLIAPSA